MFPSPRVSKAARLLVAGQFAAAEERCLRILQDEPDNILARHIYAVAIANLGRGLEAIPLLEALAAHPASHPHIHFDLGMTRANLGQISQAIAGLRQAEHLPAPEIQELRLKLETEPFLPATALQGMHAPERQAYMAAAVHKIGQGKTHLRILEIGSYMGASALTWGLAVGLLTQASAELICVDPWDSADTSQYGSGEMANHLKTGLARQVFLHNMRFLPERVSLRSIEATSVAAMAQIAGPFDIIYIDGCHLYEEVRADLAGGKALLADGGFLCGDDLDIQLHEVDVLAARSNARRDFVQDPRTQQFFHPGVTLAVGEAFGPVSLYRGFWIMQRQDVYFTKVSLAGAIGLIPRHWPETSQARVREAIAADGVLSQLV